MHQNAGKMRLSVYLAITTHYMNVLGNGLSLDLFKKVTFDGVSSVRTSQDSVHAAEFPSFTAEFH